jgi:hypothetical protein
MATSESEFKSQFRKDLARAYPDAHVFTNNDMFRAGLPDFSVLWAGTFIGIEAKFIHELPKHNTSKCLKHEVTTSQIEFLRSARRTKNYSAILIGMPDVAVLMMELKHNYLLGEVLAAPRIERSKGAWQVGNFINLVITQERPL